MLENTFKENFDLIFDHYEKIEACIASCVMPDQISAIETMVETFQSKWESSPTMQTLAHSLTRKIRKAHETFNDGWSDATPDDEYDIGSESIQS